MTSIHLRQWIYKRGYIVRETQWNGIVIKYAYTLDGEFIGTPRLARKLLKLGIKPERSREDRIVCDIGYSDQEKKWYGWASNLGLTGFKVGDRYERKDIQTLEQAREAAVHFTQEAIT